MTVELEISAIAHELYGQYRREELELVSLSDTLDRVQETENIDAIALAYLLGLMACRTWFNHTRGEFEFVKHRRDFTNPGAGKTTDAHEEAKIRFDELRETTRDRMENLLTLGYMAVYGFDHINRGLIAPIANCVAEIFDLPSAEGHWEGMEDNVNKSLSIRCRPYIKEGKKIDGEEAFVKGEEFFKTIITSLYVETPLDL